MPVMVTLLCMAMDGVSSLNGWDHTCGPITKASATPFSIYVEAIAGISETLDKVLVATTFAQSWMFSVLGLVR